MGPVEWMSEPNQVDECWSDPQFAYAYSFNEKLAAIRIGDNTTGKYGFIESRQFAVRKSQEFPSMTRHLIAVLIAASIASGGCQQMTSTADRSGAESRPASASGTATTAEAPPLPAPKTAVSVQTKYLKAVPLKSGAEPAYLTVVQWVFQPDGEKDGTLICVGDGDHCIELQKLKDELNRPANDPLGIRPIKR